MKYDVVIIGGSAAGLIAGKTAKLSHPGKSVLIIRKEEISLVPCGIPYIFSTLNSIDDNKMGIDPLKKLGVEFLIEEVKKVDVEDKKILTEKNEIKYDKLVFATGSTPFVPSVEGIENEGVYIIPKDYDYLKKIMEPISKAANIVVIGAGFIGVEMSDELRQEGKNVTLVEAMNSVLPLAFDEDISEIVSTQLVSKGLKISTGSKVVRIVGKNGHVTSVELDNGDILKADAVILSIGYRPNTELAVQAGIFMGRYNAIWTDEYQRTSTTDVFAAGDCAEHKDFFTRKATKLMLASTATFDARVAGMNLFGIRLIKQNKGNISIFSSAIDGLAIGAAGITEKTARNEGFEIKIGKFTATDRHPGTIPDKSAQTVKLVFSKSEGVLLGAQVATGKSAGELINILGLAIQQGMTAVDLVTVQFGTHPLLTAAPTMYPAIVAAESVAREICCG
ncbi:MAG: pyridine nucleotide-disulfide oxidoreductase [Spirochaetes bacterium]|nr:MAG: pyridine nucleotide-disulfide oxidoreductase [Spirochaetota bacterium]